MRRVLWQSAAQPMIGSAIVCLPDSWAYDGTGKAIYMLGGVGTTPPLGGNPASRQQLDGNIPGDHPRQWCDAGGYAVIVLPYNPIGWGGPDLAHATLGVFAKIYAALQPSTGINHAAKVGGFGYSMGGLGILNNAKRQGGSIIGPLLLVEPVTDLDWATGNAGGYSPSYALTYSASTYNGSASGSDPGPLTGAGAQAQAQFSQANTTASSLPGGLVAGAGTLFVTLPIPVNTPTSGSFTCGALTATYTGWTNVGTSNTGFAFTGVGSSAGGTTASGTSFTPPGGSSSWATQSAGWKVRDEYSTWSASKGLIVHCRDDNVVPPGQSDAFVAGAGVNWSVLHGQDGAHVFPLDNVPTSTTLAFWQANL